MSDLCPSDASSIVQTQADVMAVVRLYDERMVSLDHRSDREFIGRAWHAYRRLLPQVDRIVSKEES